MTMNINTFKSDDPYKVTTTEASETNGKNLLVRLYRPCN